MPGPNHLRVSEDPVAPLFKQGTGRSTAVLFLHGFTGSPAVWKPIAKRVHEETNAAVSIPLLPGHALTPAHLSRSRWAQWVDAAQTAATELSTSHERLIVCGLSMGGALAAQLAADSGRGGRLVLVNPAFFLDNPAAPFARLLKFVMPYVPAIGNDIALPGQDEHAYRKTPVAAVAQLHAGLKHVRERVPHIVCPVDVYVSSTDHVVGPRSYQWLSTALPHPPKLTVLRQSYHVATLDYDADVIADGIIDALASDD